jgi:hypothetical protein
MQAHSNKPNAFMLFFLVFFVVCFNCLTNKQTLRTEHPPHPDRNISTPRPPTPPFVLLPAAYSGSAQVKPSRVLPQASGLSPMLPEGSATSTSIAKENSSIEGRQWHGETLRERHNIATTMGCIEGVNYRLERTVAH